MTVRSIPIRPVDAPATGGQLYGEPRTEAPAPQAGGAQLVTEYRYDAAGNRIVALDAQGQVTKLLLTSRCGPFRYSGMAHLPRR